MANVTIPNSGGFTYTPTSDLPPQQPQTDPGRSLSLAAGSPMDFSGAFGSNTGNSDYASKFGMALTGLLQKAQAMQRSASSNLTTGGLNYSDAGINASNAQLTNPALRGYAPSTIMNAGSTAASPFQTGAQGLTQIGSTFNEQLGNFSDALGNAKNLMADYQAQQEKAQANAQNLIHEAIASGSDAVAALVKSQPDLVKLAGYSPDTLNGVVTALKKTEAQNSYKTYHSTLTTLTPTTTSIVDPQTDAQVKAIIASRPGDGGYGDAFNAVKAKFGDQVAQAYDQQYQSIFNKGQSVDQAFGVSSGNIPTDLAPYVNVSHSGIKYVDASTLQGTATQKNKLVNEAASLGLKVITNKNTAADIANIADASNKLDTIDTIMSNLTQPTALARNLHNLGLTQFEKYAQTDPQKAAAGSLQSVGLDMLKALSGVQGFRGNATVVAQINAHLPTVYDSTAVAKQKIDYLRQLIADRENGLLGTSESSGSSSNDYNSYLKAIGK